jgi:hypothetical protein
MMTALKNANTSEWTQKTELKASSKPK